MAGGRKRLLRRLPCPRVAWWYRSSGLALLNGSLTGLNLHLTLRLHGDQLLLLGHGRDPGKAGNCPGQDRRPA